MPYSIFFFYLYCHLSLYQHTKNTSISIIAILFFLIPGLPGTTKKESQTIKKIRREHQNEPTVKCGCLLMECCLVCSCPLCRFVILLPFPCLFKGLGECRVAQSSCFGCFFLFSQKYTVNKGVQCGEFEKRMCVRCTVVCYKYPACGQAFLFFSLSSKRGVRLSASINVFRTDLFSTFLFSLRTQKSNFAPALVFIFILWWLSG